MIVATFDDAQRFWDQRFAAPEYIFGTRPNRFLAGQAARFKPGQAVLDVACGEGRNSVWLAEQGCEVAGIDVSPLALQKARRLAEEHTVTVAFEQADIRTYGWGGGRFDAIVCIFIQFAAPADRERLFTGFLDTLKPGGIVVLQGYTPRQLEYRTGGPGDLAHLYTRDMLEAAFGVFEMLLLEEHEDVLDEGTKHVGRSARIDLVARKRA